MATNSSILGDSWVVEAAASPPSKRHDAAFKSQPSHGSTDQTKKAPSPRETRTSDGSASMATSASGSSFSGPELIMPSIYETPVSEGSWVAPNVRSSRQRQGQAVQRRAQPSSGTSTSPRDQNPHGEEDKGSEHDHPRNHHHDKEIKSPPSFVTRLEPSLRILLNALLLASISHLLILPELIAQCQSFFCPISALSSLYPTSCTTTQPPFTFTSRGPINHDRTTPHAHAHAQTHDEKLTLHATTLERLFTSTLDQLSPLPPLLKHSDARLRALHSDLGASFPGRRHELDLEFSGLWESWRAGSRKFDSLRADLRSAVDNLIATSSSTSGGHAHGSSGAGKHGGRGHEASHAPRAQPQTQANARAAQISSAQLSRREAYLDQLTARMQGKAEALSSDLATVEDHLESIEGIIAWEHDQARSSSLRPGEESPVKPGGRGGGLLSQLFSLGGVRQAPSRGRSDREAFTAAATGHRAVAEAVRNLSQRLDAVQRRNWKIG